MPISRIIVVDCALCGHAFQKGDKLYALDNITVIASGVPNGRIVCEVCWDKKPPSLEIVPKPS